MNTTFHNVTITINAATPEAAYAELFKRLCPNGETKIEVATDTYSTGSPEDTGGERPTEELWGK